MKTPAKLLLAVAVLVATVAVLVLRSDKNPAPEPPPATTAATRSGPAAPAVVASPAPSAAAATIQPDTVSAPSLSTNDGPRTKFADISAREARAIMGEIRKQDFPTILRLWLEADHVEHDPMKHGALLTTLGFAMAERPPPPSFFAQMRAFIEDSSNSKLERQLLLGASGLAGSKETVDFLIDLATTLRDPEMRAQARSQLAGVGVGSKGGMILVPALERVWRESRDEELVVTVAGPLAEISAPSSINLLLAAALGPGDVRTNTHKRAALDSFQLVYLASAVPPLVSRLDSQPPTSEAAKLIVPVLVRNIGDATAGKAATDWLRNRSENLTPLVRDLVVQQTRAPEMVKAWQAALSPAVSFRNEANREAIRAGLAAR